MMTKKSEMAEWILDFFRREKASAGQAVLFRNVQNKVHELTPKERDMFALVINELTENGYFSFEEGKSQLLRLTVKGAGYIYDEHASLDCCRDEWKPNRVQIQYLIAWHDNFVHYIKCLLAGISIFERSPDLTKKDRDGLEALKNALLDPDVKNIERDLAEGKVKNKTLESITKLYKKIVDICVEHLSISPVGQEFWKKILRLQIESEAESEKMRMKALQIPVGEK